MTRKSRAAVCQQPGPLAALAARARVQISAETIAARVQDERVRAHQLGRAFGIRWLLVQLEDVMRVEAETRGF